MAETPAYQNILVDIDAETAVATITLNRPKALNALDELLVAELVEAAELLDRSSDVRVIIITGSERAFAAGADIKQMSDRTYPEIRTQRLFGEFDRLAAIDTPIITAVAGFALGGGCELAMIGDIILAAETARFGQPEINLGIVPGLGGTQRLTRAIGKAKAMDLVLTGRMIDAAEADRIGLVSRVLPAEGFLDQVREIAAGIAAQSVPALTVATTLVDRAFDTTLTEGIRAEREAFYSLFGSHDQREGMAAFIEKRTAQWKR